MSSFWQHCRFFLVLVGACMGMYLLIGVGRHPSNAAAPDQAPARVINNDKPVDNEIAEGYYSIEGQIGNKSYAGIVHIDKPAIAQHYVITWFQGGAVYRGLGIRDGNKLVASWANTEQIGVTIFAVGKDKLVGRWAVRPGDGQIHTETLILLKAKE